MVCFCCFVLLLQLGTLVFGSELCYEAGGDTDPCTYLFHELPADASEEVQTEVEEGVWRELFIGRILQEGSAAGGCSHMASMLLPVSKGFMHVGSITLCVSL